MNMYWVTYLAQRPETPEAREEKASPGWYRHRALLAAEDENSIVGELRRKGASPVSIKAARPRLPFMDKVKADYKQSFLSAIAFNMSAGMSAGKAFLAVAEGEAGHMRERMDPGISVIQRGGTFAAAIDALGFFDETTKAIIGAGERTGNLRKSIEAAVGHYASWSSNLRVAYSLVGWLIFEFVFSVLSVAAVRFQMLPSVESSGSQVDLPQAEREAVKSALEFAYASNDVLLVVALVALVIVIFGCSFWFTGTEKDRNMVARVLQKIPHLREHLNDKALSAAAKAMSSLLRGGISFEPALKMVSASVRNLPVSDYLKQTLNRLYAGESVAQALQSPLLNRSEQMLLAAHADQRQLASILEQVHESRTRSSQTEMKAFLKWSGGIALVYNLMSLAAWVYILKIQSMQTMPI